MDYNYYKVHTYYVSTEIVVTSLTPAATVLQSLLAAFLFSRGEPMAWLHDGRHARHSRPREWELGREDVGSKM